MEELIAELIPIRRTSDATVWRPRVFAAEREDGTWAAWIQFIPVSGDGPVMTTAVETTQPSREAVAYWSCGLEDVYLEGALNRASSHLAGAPPLDVQQSVARAVLLHPIDLYVLDFVRRSGDRRVAAARLFASQMYPNADLVRSLERLEREYRLVARVTANGAEWLELTGNGAESLETAMVTDDTSLRPI